MLIAPSCLTIQVPVRIEYTFYMPDKRTRDIGNYEKVVTDLLVNRGVIPDDDITHIKEINLRFGGFDRQNPRVDLEVYQYE